jgi:hypothetical protein
MHEDIPIDHEILLSVYELLFESYAIQQLWSEGCKAVDQAQGLLIKTVSPVLWSHRAVFKSKLGQDITRDMLKLKVFNLFMNSAAGSIHHSLFVLFRITMQKLKRKFGLPCHASNQSRHPSLCACKTPSQHLRMRQVVLNSFSSSKNSNVFYSDLTELLADCHTEVGKWHYVNNSSIELAIKSFDNAAILLKKLACLLFR